MWSLILSPGRYLEGEGSLFFFPLFLWCYFQQPDSASKPLTMSLLYTGVLFCSPDITCQLTRVSVADYTTAVTTRGLETQNSSEAQTLRVLTLKIKSAILRLFWIQSFQPWLKPPHKVTQMCVSKSSGGSSQRRQGATKIVPALPTLPVASWTYLAEGNMC